MVIPHNYLSLNDFFVVYLFTCAYIVWVISPPCLLPHLPPLPSSVSGGSCSALIADFVEKRTYT
jgi:hypothetical protein